MQKIELFYDYRCYPIWIIHSDGGMDPRLPDELAGNHELDNRLVSLQKRYDDLFINNAHEFSFNDFHSDEERQQFIVDSNKVFDEVKRLIGPGKYVFEEDDWLKKS